MEFDVLVAQGVAAPVDGWDFSWFDGRATEQRPSWGYAQLLSERLGRAPSALDLQTGGAEVLSWAARRAARQPSVLAATESWPPNASIAKAALGELGGSVVRAADGGSLPFRDEAFGLVSSRHPVGVVWDEVARVLWAGGTFLSQMVGAGTNRELYEYVMGPQPPSRRPTADAAAAAASAAGLEVVDLRAETLEVAFFDLGAVVHFLRKVVWTVPDFSVERYHDRLRALHDQIHHDGHFVCHSKSYLIEAKK